ERTLRFLPERHRGRTFLKLPFVYAASDPVPQAGSLSFRPSTTIAFLEDLGRSLAAQGFRDVVVSNFHGSPRHFLAIETACDRVSRERGIQMVCLFSAMLSRLNGGGSELGGVLGHLPGVDEADFAGDTHGGLVETSQLLALHPEWVDPDHKELPRRTVDLWLEERGESRPEAGHGKIAALGGLIRSLQAGLRFFQEETYSGAPGKASAELGEQILDTLGERSAEVLTRLLDRTLPEAEWHSPLWKMRHVFVHPAAVKFFDTVLQVPKTVS
ncbi:MAG: creatininase family protein, partial [Myxococcales bacterium]|nr:creatininase family protein [Myxococcales bacterium]